MTGAAARSCGVLGAEHRVTACDGNNDETGIGTAGHLKAGSKGNKINDLTSTTRESFGSMCLWASKHGCNISNVDNMCELRVRVDSPTSCLLPISVCYHKHLLQAKLHFHLKTTNKKIQEEDDDIKEKVSVNPAPRSSGGVIVACL